MCGVYVWCVYVWERGGRERGCGGGGGRRGGGRGDFPVGSGKDVFEQK